MYLLLLLIKLIIYEIIFPYTWLCNYICWAVSPAGMLRFTQSHTITPVIWSRYCQWHSTSLQATSFLVIGSLILGPLAPARPFLTEHMNCNATTRKHIYWVSYTRLLFTKVSGGIKCRAPGATVSLLLVCLLSACTTLATPNSPILTH